MQLTPPDQKARATRFDAGTDAPIPIGNEEFARVHAQVEQEHTRRSLRQKHASATEATSVFLTYALTVTAVYHTLATPQNYKQMLKSKQRGEWWDAMTSEYTSLVGLGTWELTPRPPGAKVLGSMWNFRIKEKSDGSIDKFKARLVARGDQQHSSSFTEIFAPVIKFVTLRSVHTQHQANGHPLLVRLPYHYEK